MTAFRCEKEHVRPNHMKCLHDCAKVWKKNG